MWSNFCEFLILQISIAKTIIIAAIITVTREKSDNMIKKL